MIEREIKANGFEPSRKLMKVIEAFEAAVEKTFDGALIRHFLYGDKLDMVTVVISDGHYGNFNLTADRVSFNGHCCMAEDCRKFEALTFNDELYEGKLFEIAGLN